MHIYGNPQIYFLITHGSKKKLYVEFFFLKKPLQPNKYERRKPQIWSVGSA